MVCIVLGAVFALFALGCFGLGASWMAGGAPAAGFAPVLAFGLFWCALATLLLWLGLRGRGRLQRDERLRSSGLRGRATVLSYSDSRLKVDGATIFELSLRIELEGRPPWDVNRKEGVMRLGRIHNGATLPVLVSPGDPTELMIDWYADI